MKILAVGDLVGAAGVKKLKTELPKIRENEKIDFVIVNGENAGEGRGITKKNFDDILSEKVDVITMGNHTWGKKDIFSFIDHPKILRPANYCNTVPGKGYNIYEYGNKKIAVIGNGEYAIHEAKILKNVSEDVTIFTNGRELPQNRSIEITNFVEGKIDSIRGKEKASKIVLNDNTEYEIDGIFVAEGTASSIDFAKKLGIFLENNNIKVDENMQTNIPGIYAAGDCTGGLLQISKAVYEGAKSGLSIAKKLKNI